VADAAYCEVPRHGARADEAQGTRVPRLRDEREFTLKKQQKAVPLWLAFGIITPAKMGRADVLRE
jgi:hypothetical protein